jgi:serine phosphatase RsbU (regulator of sigma subunit)
MDIILCAIDTETNLLNLASVKNPLYKVSRGELTEYRALNYSGTECDEKCEFLSKKVQLEVGDTLYFSSDGYPDQFGGSNHRKYSRQRLKSFLQTIQICSMPEQGDMLYEEIEKWREEKNEDQTDDILLLGIRI